MSQDSTSNPLETSLASAMRKEVAFVDTNVADWRTLVAGIRPGIEVVLIESGKSGLDTLACWAETHSGYDAIHVLSHGSEGSLRLGRDTVTSASLSDAGVQAELARLGQALSPDGDLLIYGCSVAAGEAGQTFIANLAAATGADVAASDDPTGASRLDGDWVLERTSGNIETTPLNIARFSGSLAAPILGNDTAPNDGSCDYYATVLKNSDQNTVYDSTKYFVNANNKLSDLLGIDITSGGYSWTVTSGPSHGTLVNTLGASTSGSGSPAGTLYYVPTSGYTGSDSVDVRVSGASGSDTMTIHVNVVEQAVLGGTAATGNLRVTVTGGQIYTERYNGTDWEQQYFSASGGLLDLNGDLHALGTYYTYGAGNMIPEADFVSQTATATAITTTWNVNGVEIVQSVTLPSATSKFIKINWTATNNSGADIANVHFLRGIDSYLSGGDTGSGFWDSATNTVGVTKEIGGITQRLGFQGITAPNTHASKNYGDVGVEVTNGGTLSNGIDPDSNVDNGYALEWANTTLSNGEVWTIKSYESFVAAPVSIAGGDIESTAGGAVTLSYTVSNSSGSTQAVNYSASVPAGWDAAVLSAASGSITNNNSSVITVTVTPPSGVSLGSYDVTLLAATIGGDAEGIGQVDVTTPPTPTVSSVTASTVNGSYKAGDVIGIQVTFSEAVTVTGTPQLTLETGTTDRTVNYASGSGGTTLTFTYTVQAGDTSADLDYVATSSLALNSGTIVATSGGAAATLTLASPGAANSLGANKAIVIDTTAPVIGAVGIPNATMKVGDSVTATITVADDGGSTYTLGGSTIGGFTLGGLARSNSTTYTASFTVTEGGTDVAAGSGIPVSVVLSDTAGNSNSAYTTAIAQAGDAINAHSPTDIALANNSVATIGGANAVVGALGSTDASSGDTFTYSLVAGSGSTDNASFNISGGDLRANNASALIAGSGYSVRVRTTDAAGNTFDKAFAVNAVVGPAIASATYDAASGVLAVTGSLMEVMTGVTNDIAVGKLTLTGEGGATYVLTSSDVEVTSATAFSVTLNATDKAAVNQILNKDGISSTSGTSFNLAAADDWNSNVTTGDTSDATNTVTASNVPAPAITSATYDYSSNALVVTGSGFLKKSGTTNDIDISKLAFTGEGGATYTLTSASDVEIDSATQFTVTLAGADLTQVEALLSANGASAAGGTVYNLAAAEDWAAGAAAAVNVADLTGNGITVSNWAAPTVTSATYDWSSGQLALAGTNFVNASGATNDLVANKLTLTGEGGSYTLTDSANVEITSATAATVTLSAADQLNIHGLLNKNGTTSSGAATYNLAAADNWLAGSPAASDIADATGNGITVSNVATPAISSATYDSDSGILSVTGSNLFKKAGATNDVDISMLTFTGGTANATYTLTSASDVEITSATSFSVTLAGADKTSVDALLDQMGTTSTGSSTYNLAAAEDWLAGADAAANIADASNAVTVSISPRITSATYNAATGVLQVTGTNIQANGGGMDIDASKLTLTGEDSATYTLTDTANVERDSATQFTLTLSATDKAALNQIVNQNGSSSTGSTTYNLAAADDWNTQVTAGDTSDTTGNGITASNVATPAIASATYDAATGVLAVTGSGFLKKSGAANDIDVSKLTLAGEGGDSRALTTGSVEITSGTAFSVTLNAADLAAVNQILNRSGTSATGGATYNLAAAEDWAAGAASAVVVADLTGNGITVGNPTTPTIASATYNSTTGVLAVTGSGFLELAGATNDIVANKLTITGQGGATYTLTDTANVEITSGTAFTLTLSSTDKTGVAALVNKAGASSTDNTTYNLAAAEDWAAGAASAVVVADLTGNGITATVNQSPVITSNGGGTTAAVNVAENSTAVTTVTATDGDGDTPTFSITGGADQAKFSINATTGALAFASAPDFETPTDSDTNNTYIVAVTASDGNGGTDVQTITVTVTDVGEGGGGGVDIPPVTPPTTTTTTTTPPVTVDGATVSTTTVATATSSGTQTVSTQTVAPVTETRQEVTGTAHQTLADIPLATDNNGETLLQISLPLGVGLSSQTITGSGASTLRDLLIAASDPKVTDTTVFGQILAHGIDAYVPTVQDQQQVTVRTITFSDTATLPGQSIVITGALGTGESNALHPLRQEALVVDTRDLPAGTVLTFDNVEFAIVVGAATLTGGNGRNFVIGDGASQHIVLGADDDELHGGAGNDYIGSKGGNDKLYGDEGDDTVSGGDDNDTLDGGTGVNFEHGGKDVDTATFAGAASRYRITYDHGQTVVRSLDNANDVDTLVNVETLHFADQDINVIPYATDYSWIATLYRQVLGRQAELAGFQFWAQVAAEGQSHGDVALNFLRSRENGIQFDTLDVAAKIECLYTDLLGRPSELAGKEYWLQQYANGMSMTEVAWNFVHSVELTGQYLTPTGWDFLDAAPAA